MEVMLAISKERGSMNPTSSGSSPVVHHPVHFPEIALHGFLKLNILECDTNCPSDEAIASGEQFLFP